MFCEWSRPTAVSVTESQTLAGTPHSSASWLRQAHSFPPGLGEPSWTRKSGSLGNLGQTFSRLQITRDGLIELCQSERRKGLMDTHVASMQVDIWWHTETSFFNLCYSGSFSLIKSFLKNFKFPELVVESNPVSQTRRWFVIKTKSWISEFLRRNHDIKPSGKAIRQTPTLFTAELGYCGVWYPLPFPLSLLAPLNIIKPLPFLSLKQLLYGQNFLSVKELPGVGFIAPSSAKYASYASTHTTVRTSLMLNQSYALCAFFSWALKH